MQTADSNAALAHREAERKEVLRKSLDAIDTLQARLNAVEQERNEPVAVIGLSCRYPGAPSTEAYWRLLIEGRDAITEVPEGRWDKDAYYDPDPSAPGKIHAPFGGFLDQVDLFDAPFFGIAGREAETMDPQQRLVLEVAWEALEDAGVPADRLRGSAAGVFVGITTTDYARMTITGKAADLDVYTATGGALNVAAGRLAYVLGLNGPAMAVDTACSSSLVAVHLACQSLRAREINTALAGGVNLLLTPEPFVCFAKWGMMAPDGRCKTFDERADGFVRSEGCGIIVLKRLSDAIAAGDRVLALIRGSAVNQDGASSGLTVPNGLAQQAVIRSALSAAKLDPEAVDYIEAHGTGTKLGDPIELEALGAVLGKRPADRPLRIGSVKTNIGHAESASGIAGLIKVILSMQREQIPPHIHFKKLSSNISLGRASIEIPVRPFPWPRADRTRIAGVSSFGFSGTNAHVILQEAPPMSPPVADKPSPDRSTHLLVLSAGSENGLRNLAKSYADALELQPAGVLADFCHSAAACRAALPYRAAMTVKDIESARTHLGSLARGMPTPEIHTGRGRPDTHVAFLFTGQGSQYSAMGRTLYELEPVFRDAFDRCASLLKEYLDYPLQDILGYGSGAPTVPSGLLDETRYTQPALFAFEFALAALWRSWGIQPTAVAGHSLGEFVAACVAGVLDLEDALRMVAVRSRLMQALPRDGTMAAVLADESYVQNTIQPYARTVAIAAANGPRNTVVSGNTAHVQELIERFKQDGIPAKQLNVSHAFHSPLMEPMLDEFERFAQQIHHQPATLDLVLNGTGKLLDDAHPLDAKYWRRHIRGTVRFADSIRALAERGITTFLEVGPAPVLIGMARECLADSEGVFLPSLRKGAGEWEQMLASLGALFVRGFKPDWNAFDRPYARRRVSLPTYPFQRQRYWLPAVAREPGSPPARAVPGVHPLLGVHVPLAGRPGEHVWFGEISLATCPWVSDHRVKGVAVVPATAYIEMAIFAAVQAFGPPPVVLSRIEFSKVLSLQGDTVFEVQTRLWREGNGKILFEVHGRMRGTNDWVKHARGTLRMGLSSGDAASADRIDVSALQKNLPEQLNGEAFYRLHHERGNEWGPAFRGTKQVWFGRGEALAEIEAPTGVVSDLDQFLFHPALSDASGHALTATIPLPKDDGIRGGAFVGAGIDEIRFHRRFSGQRLWALARMRDGADAPSNVLVGDVSLYDEAGELVAETIGARLWYLDSAGKQDVLESVDNWFYAPRWVTRDFDSSKATVPFPRGVWVVFRDEQGVAECLCQELRSRGATCLTVIPGEGYQRTEPGVVSLRPEEPADFERLVSRVNELGLPLAGVVHLWSLDAASPERVSPDSIRTAESNGSISAIRLVQALRRTELARSTRLWLVTRGAQPVANPPGPLEILQSPLWGIGRTLAVECSEFWGGQVDLDRADTPKRAANLLIRQIIDPEGEDQVAFRNGQRLVLRLDRLTLSEKSVGRPPVRSDAAYIITGGLGGIGGEVARWLVGQGARHLCLVGRRPVPPRGEWNSATLEGEEGERISLVRELEERGAAVQVISMDVADETAVRNLIGRYLKSGAPPLCGVFHLAGAMQYQLLTDQTPEDVRQIFRAKVTGAWLLHQNLAKSDLDYFVLFSSSSALLSSPMMAAYSAANVFLDTLAHHRRAGGLPAVSINWGTWTEIGMATRFQAHNESKRAGRVGAAKGVKGLTTQRALEAMERLLNAAPPQIGVMPIDWEEWQRSYGDLAATPYLSLLVPVANSGAPATDASQRAGEPAHTDVPRAAESSDGEEELTQTSLRKSLLAMPAKERLNALSLRLSKEAAMVLRVKSLDPEAGLTEQGMDSLMAMELRNRLRLRLGIDLPVRALFEAPTVAGLAQHVETMLWATKGNSEGGETNSKDRVVIEI